MKRLIFLLALGIPLSAASVTYTFAAGDQGFSLVTTDFLPNIAVGPTYLAQQIGHVTQDCGAGAVTGLHCGQDYFTVQGGMTEVGMRVYGDDFDYLATEEYFNGVDLAHVGTWTDTQNRTTLTISQDCDPTVAPEPSSFLLLGLGLVGVERARRLFNRTVNSNVVVGSRAETR